MRTSREARLETFRSRRNKAFALIRVLETELLSERDHERVLVLQARLARARKRMHGAMQRMARVGLSPTNREIGARPRRAQGHRGFGALLVEEETRLGI